MKEMFPVSNETVLGVSAGGEIPPFTAEELGKAAVRIKTGRAVNCISEAILAKYNQLLQAGKFPRKKQR